MSRQVLKDSIPIDHDLEELAELVPSDTCRRFLSGLAKVMMTNPTEPCEPRLTHLLIDIVAVNELIKNQLASIKQVPDAADSLQKEHLVIPY